MGELHRVIIQGTMVASTLAIGLDGFKKISSHHLKSPIEGGKRFQGDGAADAAMVVVVPFTCFDRNGFGDYGFLHEAGTDVTF